MVYAQLRASLDQIWQILVGANKMTSFLQDKRQKKAWQPRSPGDEVACFGRAVENVAKFHTL